jgi:hypothetical protein
MTIFNSYFSLPEGKPIPLNHVLWQLFFTLVIFETMDPMNRWRVDLWGFKAWIFTVLVILLDPMLGWKILERLLGCHFLLLGNVGKIM